MDEVVSVSNLSLRPVAIAVSTTTSVTSMTGNSSKARRSWANFGQPVLVHCENALICDALGEAKREVIVTAHDYVASRPVFTEWSDRRVLYRRKSLVAVCVCHVSGWKVLKEVTRASGRSGCYL
ncbi:hypothetical protein DMI62_14550 [Escherichia coli]|nr:hypothetical protein [Escherichia coli]